MDVHRFSSTNVDKATYDEDDGELIVTFKSGRRYRYTRVPASTWKDFVEASSPGAFAMRTLVKYNPREIAS